MLRITEYLKEKKNLHSSTQKVLQSTKAFKYDKKELIEKSGIISSAFPVSINEDLKK